MSDLISRQAVLDRTVNRNSIWNKITDSEGNNLEDILNSIPSVENKGEWIKIQSGDKDFPESIVCSKCNNENSHLDFNEHGEPIGKVFVTSKYCPNCGADMRGE